MVWIGRLGRLGMVAQGVVYTIVAVLAIGFAFGLGGKPADQSGAFHTLAGEWYGAVALGLLAAGLAGYALWRFAVAALGEKAESVEDVGLGKRLAYFARGLAYAGLCYTAATRIVRAGGSGGGSNEQQTASTVFDYPAGRWLVGIVGIGLVVYGLWNGYRALTKHFEQDLKTTRMSVEEKRLVCGFFGRAGFAARGFVLGLIGAFLVKAAVAHDPRDAVGLDGALQELAQQPHGRALLVVVAAGLLAYGLFGFARARYRQV